MLGSSADSPLSTSFFLSVLLSLLGVGSSMMSLVL